MIDRISMPKELLAVLEEHISSSRTNTEGKYQGGDALLEEFNKESKSWLKLAGIPTGEQWTQVFRNLDDMNNVSICL